VGDLVEEPSDVRGDILELNFGVLTKADVAVVPPEILIVVGVVVAQDLAYLGMVVLEPVEPLPGVIFVWDGEHFDSPSGNGTVQFQRVDHLL